MRRLWLAVRAALEVVLGRQRLDRCLWKVGFFDFKTWLLRTQRALPDGGSVVLLPEDERIIDEVYGGAYAQVPILAGDTVVDVGAHIGVFSVRAARLSAGGRLVAVEPAPANLKFLRRNLMRNGAKAEIVACATSDKEGEAELRYPGDSALFTLDAAAPAAYSVKVRVRTLDSILRELGVAHVDLLKIDNEWSEHATLLGARETLKGAAQIVIEIGRRGKEPARTIRLLEDSGFACSTLVDTPGGVVVHARRRE